MTKMTKQAHVDEVLQYSEWRISGAVRDVINQLYDYNEETKDGLHKQVMVALGWKYYGNQHGIQRKHVAKQGAIDYTNQIVEAWEEANSK
jgi:hypothetical protein